MNKLSLWMRRLGVVISVLMLVCAGPGFTGSASAEGAQAAGDDALLSEQSPNPVVGSGQVFQIYITLYNSGSTTWQKGTYWLQNIQNPFGALPSQPLSGPVVPTGLSVWTIRLTAPTAFGVYRTSWRASHSGVFFGPQVNIDIKVAPGWVGAVTVTSDAPLVAVGRPEIGSLQAPQTMAYSGYPVGSPVVYVPMLFSKAFGNLYDAALYIQNIDPDISADIAINYYDTNGNVTCVHLDNIPPLASKGYWMPAECVPKGWVGGAVITSNRNIVALGRPHIGAEITSYNGFASGSKTMYVPMLFRRAWGSYDAALYIQNTSSDFTANITIQYYDFDGNPTCSHADTLSPRAARGYWMRDECMPNGWAGGAVITSDQDIVAVGRPHIGAQITAYNGFETGGPNVVVPMLYRNAGDTVNYTSALYIQDLDSITNAGVTMDFYDVAGNLTCSMTDSIPPYSSRGYWLPSLDCLPDGWEGSVHITADRDVVALGRPHYGAEIFAYDGFSLATGEIYLPMLFRVAYGGTYNSSFYLHNTDPTNAADVTIKYYDSTGSLVCTQTPVIDPLASLETLIINVDLPCP